MGCSRVELHPEERKEMNGLKMSELIFFVVISERSAKSQMVSQITEFKIPLGISS